MNPRRCRGFEVVFLLECGEVVFLCDLLGAFLHAYAR
jgi:hypothetical protein